MSPKARHLLQHLRHTEAVSGMCRLSLEHNYTPNASAARRTKRRSRHHAHRAAVSQSSRLHIGCGSCCESQRTVFRCHALSAARRLQHAPSNEAALASIVSVASAASKRGGTVAGSKRGRLAGRVPSAARQLRSR